MTCAPSLRALALALCAALSCALAAQADAPLWLNMGGMSWHPSAPALNGVNPGLGLQYGLDRGHFVAAGYYRNSIDRDSHYAVYGRRLLGEGAISFGITAGAVDGYKWRAGGIIPFAAPYLSIEGQRIGAHLVIIPRIEKQVSMALALQIKLRLQ